MRSEPSRLRQFLTAEEVPRWFGFSLVLIYLVGVGSVSYYGIVEARREGITRFHAASQYSFSRLAERLGEVARGQSEPIALGGYHRLLRQFSAAIPAFHIRVLDGAGHILASLAPGEVGGQTSPPSPMPSSGNPDARGPLVTSVDGREGFVLQARIPRSSIQPNIVASATHRSDSPNEDQGLTSEARLGPQLFLEAVIPILPPATESSADVARWLALLLIVLGALWVIYRGLREHFRGISQVVDRLRHRETVSVDQLSSLLIPNSADEVTASWNELIDLVQGLYDDVQRGSANDELLHVLKTGGGGALADGLNAVPEAVLFVQDSDTIRFANTAARRLFGWDADESVDLAISTASANGGGEKILESIRSALQASEGVLNSTDLVELDDPGAASAYRICIHPLKKGPYTGNCMIVIRDVSQQTRADRAREEFITQVTHELRTPLTNIRAYAETLSSGMFDDPKVITECYNVITKETRRLSRLIEDILSVSQLEIGTMEVEHGTVDLGALLTDAVRDVRGLADEKGIDLQLVLPPKFEDISADRDKLAVVLNNLLGNAIKYTLEDGNIVVGCHFNANEVVISVKDNGIGIDPVDHTRVFEKFQRGSNAEVQEITGTGIGLFTAREIVRRHGGDITLISTKKQGTTFLVRLPLEPSRVGTRSSAEQV